MAYIEGTDDQDSKRTLSHHLMFIIVASVAVFILMMGSEKIGANDVPTAVMITATIVVLMILVSFRINPLAWKRLLKRREYERITEMSRKLGLVFQGLDDSHYIFNNITFELFRIEHLVVSPQGIFVIAKVPCSGALRIEDNALFAGDRTLETITAGLWRVCHLINIVFQKGFNVDIMPVPIIVATERDSVEIDVFDQIAIVTLEKLEEALIKNTGSRLNTEQVESYAYFFKSRYS